jgi:hypothetical protein
MEAAVAAVEGRVPDEIVRALIVHPPGAVDATLTGALRGIFGRKKRKAGLHHRNVLVLTKTTVQLFACDAKSHPPVVVDELGGWPVEQVRVATVAKEKTSPGSSAGSITARFYSMTLTVPGGAEPIEVDVPRTDSARETILALEDATGSPPSKITSRRRAKRAREAEA